jgi:hypothetical protein
VRPIQFSSSTWRLVVFATPVVVLLAAWSVVTIAGNVSVDEGNLESEP